jgi:hypothetical protein
MQSSVRRTSGVGLAGVILLRVHVRLNYQPVPKRCVSRVLRKTAP